MRRYRKAKAIDMSQWVHSSTTGMTHRSRNKRPFSLFGAMKELTKSSQFQNARSPTKKMSFFNETPFTKAVNNYFRPPASSINHKKSIIIQKAAPSYFSTPIYMSSPSVRKISKMSISSPFAFPNYTDRSSAPYFSSSRNPNRKKEQLERRALDRFRIAIEKRSNGDSLVVNETIQNALKARTECRRKKTTKMAIPPLDDIFTFQLPAQKQKKQELNIQSFHQQKSTIQWQKQGTNIQFQQQLIIKPFEVTLTSLRKDNSESEKTKKSHLNLEEKFQLKKQTQQKIQKKIQDKQMKKQSEEQQNKKNKQKHLPIAQKELKKDSKSKLATINKQEKEKEKMKRTDQLIQIQDIILESKIIDNKVPQHQKAIKITNEKQKVTFSVQSQQKEQLINKNKKEAFLEYFYLLEDIAHFRQESKEFYQEKSQELQKLFKKSSYFMAHQSLYLTTKFYNFFKGNNLSAGFYCFSQEELKQLVQISEFQEQILKMEQNLEDLKKLLKKCYNQVKKQLPPEQQILQLDAKQTHHRDCCTSLIKQLQHIYIIWKSLPKNKDLQERCAYLINTLFSLKELNGEEINIKEVNSYKTDSAKFIAANKDQFMID